MLFKNAILATILLCLLASSYAFTVNLTPSCNPDCTDEIENACTQCETSGRNNCTIEFAQGEYNVFLPGMTYANGISCYGISGTTIRGYSATIISHQLKDTWQFQLMNNVSIEGLTFDLARLPHTLGKCVSVDLAGKTVTLEVDTTNYPFTFQNGYQYPYLEKAGSITEFNVTSGTWMEREIFVNFIPVNFNSGTSTMTLTLDTTQLGIFTIGSFYVVRHQYFGSSSLWLQRNNGFALKDVVFYGSAGSLIYNVRSFGTFSMDNVKLLKKAGKAISSNSDGGQWIMPSGKIEIRNCHWEGNGDDAVNIHNEFWTVTSVTASNQVAINLNGGQVPAAGDVIQFRDQTTFEILGQAVIDTYSANSIIFKDVIPETIQVGNVLEVTSRPHVTIMDSTVVKNRARGFFLSSANDSVIISNSFDQTSGIGIFISPDIYQAFSGGVANNIIIQRNTFNGINYGIAKGLADIQVNAVKAQGAVVNGIVIHTNINVASNTFTQRVGQRAIDISVTRGVNVQGNIINYFSSSLPQFNIVVQNATDITVANNLCYKDGVGLPCVEYLSDLDPNATIDTEETVETSTTVPSTVVSSTAEPSTVPQTDNTGATTSKSSDTATPQTTGVTDNQSSDSTDQTTASSDNTNTENTNTSGPRPSDTEDMDSSSIHTVTLSLCFVTVGVVSSLILM